VHRVAAKTPFLALRSALVPLAIIAQVSGDLSVGRVMPAVKRGFPLAVLQVTALHSGDSHPWNVPNHLFFFTPFAATAHTRAPHLGSLPAFENHV
jgi:hypothetical protein